MVVKNRIDEANEVNLETRRIEGLQVYGLYTFFKPLTNRQLASATYRVSRRQMIKFYA